jgi:hypothetical protein
VLVASIVGVSSVVLSVPFCVVVAVVEIVLVVADVVVSIVLSARFVVSNCDLRSETVCIGCIVLEESPEDCCILAGTTDDKYHPTYP